MPENRWVHIDLIFRLVLQFCKYLQYLHSTTHIISIDNIKQLYRQQHFQNKYQKQKQSIEYQFAYIIPFIYKTGRNDLILKVDDKNIDDKRNY